MIPCSTSPGMRNSDGAKSPTVRLQISSPSAPSARTSAAILRISEPSSEPARLERRGGFILKDSWTDAAHRLVGFRLTADLGTHELTEGGRDRLTVNRKPTERRSAR